MAIPHAQYKLRIDWAGNGDWSSGVPTGATATGTGTSVTPNYLVAVNADASDVSIGNSVMIFTSADVLKFDEIYTIIAKPSAFGFTNLTYAPESPAATVTGDVMKVVTVTGDDVTDYQLADPGITIEYGRDAGRSTGASRPGTAAFGLDNTSALFSPENPTSLLAGSVLRARPVDISATLDSVTYGLYRGRADDFDLAYGRAMRVDVSCVDGLALLSGVPVATALYTGLRTGDAVNVLLDAIGWPGTRDIDPGQTMLQWFSLDEADALDALQRLLDGEGVPSYAGCDANGNFVFRDRSHRVIRTESRNLQSTWNQTGAEPRISLPVVYQHGARDIINLVSLDVGIRKPIPLGPVWTQDEAGISIQNGETVKIVVTTPDPFYGAKVPDAAVDTSDENAVDPDIGLRYGTLVVSLSRTSGNSTTISMTASGGPAEISRMRLRAISVPVSYTVKVEARNEASIAKYGPQGPAGTLEPRWASIWDVAALAALLVSYRAERLPVVSVPFHSGTSAILVEQLTRNLSDLVHLDYPDADIDRDFYVEGIRHDITGRGTDRAHRTVFTCEAAPVTFQNPFIVGTSTLNGSAVLAPDSFIDPDDVMILDTLGSVLNTEVLAF